ncbi:MAG TPA: FAD:protein FMN transferase, partial [Flavobacteriaceae bacterium]|nr:FAD:protein FMN transferase [Flavobacteriaceae bacterium]
IESPEVQQDGRSIDKVLAIENQSLASSGNYRKFRVDSITGRKFVHTINPLTCRAEENSITSASVWASTCAQADAYATAIMAMGLERAKDLIDARPDLTVYFTYHDVNHQPQWFATPDLLTRFQ